MDLILTEQYVSNGAWLASDGKNTLSPGITSVLTLDELLTHLGSIDETNKTIVLGSTSVTIDLESAIGIVRRRLTLECNASDRIQLMNAVSALEPRVPAASTT